MKIDIHTHILPPPGKIEDLNKKFNTSGFVTMETAAQPCCANLMQNGKFFRKINSNCWDPDVRLTESDNCQVDVQVLSVVPIFFCYWASPKQTRYLAQLLNDYISGVVAADPTRFVGLATLPMQATDLAIKELERCVNQLGLAGIEIATHIDGADSYMNLDDPRLFPIFEAAEALGAAVFVHPWDMMGKTRMEKYWLPWLVGMPAETALAICTMIFSGLFDRLPRLRVAFAHAGGAFPAIMGRVEHAYYTRPDLCAIDIKQPPHDYLGRFWVDSLTHDEAILKSVIDLFGADRVALGTDYPFPLGEYQKVAGGGDWMAGDLIEKSQLTEQIKNQLLYKSALSWLNLSQSFFTGSHDG